MNLAGWIWDRFLSFFRQHLGRRGDSKLQYTTQKCLDEPDQFENSVLYLIGENEYLWHAALLCPCGCGEIIRLNLLPDDYPSWKVQISRRGVSIEPSIWRTTGCRSHFFLRFGRIQWCHSDDRFSPSN